TRDARQISQRIIGMGVIHRYRERLASYDLLEAPGNMVEGEHALSDLLKRAFARQGRSRSRQDVVNIHLADQIGKDRSLASGRDHVKAGAVRPDLQIARMKVTGLHPIR